MSLDLLLGLDPAKIKRPQKEVEITRLSELLGQPCIFTCKALTADEMDEIQEMVLEIKTQEVDVPEMQLMTILKGVADPDLKNEALLKHYDVPTPKELVRKLLLPGEVTKVYTAISDLSGYGEGAVKEVKNLSKQTASWN